MMTTCVIGEELAWRRTDGFVAAFGTSPRVEELQAAATSAASTRTIKTDTRFMRLRSQPAKTSGVFLRGTKEKHSCTGDLATKQAITCLRVSLNQARRAPERANDGRTYRRRRARRRSKPPTVDRVARATPSTAPRRVSTGRVSRVRSVGSPRLREGATATRRLRVAPRLEPRHSQRQQSRRRRARRTCRQRRDSTLHRRPIAPQGVPQRATAGRAQGRRPQLQRRAVHRYSRTLESPSGLVEFGEYGAVDPHVDPLRTDREHVKGIQGR